MDSLEALRARRQQLSQASAQRASELSLLSAELDAETQRKIERTKSQFRLRTQLEEEAAKRRNEKENEEILKRTEETAKWKMELSVREEQREIKEKERKRSKSKMENTIANMTEKINFFGIDLNRIQPIQSESDNQSDRKRKEFQNKADMQKTTTHLGHVFIQAILKQSDRYANSSRATPEHNETKVIMSGNEMSQETASQKESQLNQEQLPEEYRKPKEALKRPRDVKPRYALPLPDMNLEQQERITMFIIDQLRLERIEYTDSLCIADCYCIVHRSEQSTIIYQWCGIQSSNDKLACSAIYAVSLRNHFSSSNTIRREIAMRESEEFKAIFPNLTYAPVDRATEGGLWEPLRPQHATELYKLYKGSLRLIAPSTASLDLRGSYLLRMPKADLTWAGAGASLVDRMTLRILSAAYSRHVQHLNSADEAVPFTRPLDTQASVMDCSRSIRLMQCPEAHLAPIKLTIVAEAYCLKRAQLQSANSYVIDASTEVYLWIGSRCPAPMRLQAMEWMKKVILPSQIRAPWCKVEIEREHYESPSFKLKFRDFYALRKPLDYRSERSSGKIAPNIPVQVDIQSIFAPPRKAIMLEPQRELILQEANEVLINMTVFQLVKTKFVKCEVNMLFNKHSYIFVCLYRTQSEPICVVYFWTGKAAPRIHHKLFKLQYAPALKDSMETSITPVFVLQQKEPLALMAHLKGQIIICSDEGSDTRLFQVTVDRQYNFARVLEVSVSCKSLRSRYCFVLWSKKKTYLWISRGANKMEQRRSADIAQSITNHLGCETAYEETKEREESTDFWRLIGGSGPHPEGIGFYYKAPLQIFRCSYENGVYTASLESENLIQEEFASQVVILIDPGSPLPMWAWTGSCATPNVRTFAEKTAQRYFENCQDRKFSSHYVYIEEGSEPLDFTAYVVGWKEKKPPQPLNAYLRQQRDLRLARATNRSSGTKKTP